MLKKITVCLIAILAALWLTEIFVIHGHKTGIWWQDLKGYSIILGVLGGLGLMILAKSLGRFWLYRKEKYYD